MTKKGHDIEEYRLKKVIGNGGNANVWLANNKTGEEVAIKILIKNDKKSTERFQDEIKVMEKYGIEFGILPILKHGIHEDKYHWYSMPLAQRLDNAVKNSPTEETILAFIELGKNLARLHKIKVFHRDIKPQNIFQLEGEFLFGDFGLVAYPEKKQLTKNDERIGAKWTIAPELERPNQEADYGLADVYSFAKSLWMAIVKSYAGFEGQYNKASSISISAYNKDEFTPILDELLEKCTDNDPKNRPDMDHTVLELEKWIEHNRDFRKSNATQWTDILKTLFPVCIPNEASWIDIESIHDVLKMISKHRALNHAFLPDGGGLDLTDVTKSKENGCLEISLDGYPCILNPRKLYFVRINDDTQWNYFRLELNPINETGLNSKTSKHKETIAEFEDGTYHNLRTVDILRFNGQPEPHRIIARYTSGVFLFFQKTSRYNQIPHTYDEKFCEMAHEDFKLMLSIALDNKSTLPAEQSAPTLPIDHNAPEIIYPDQNLIQNFESKVDITIDVLKHMIASTSEYYLYNLEHKTLTKLRMKEYLLADRPNHHKLAEKLESIPRNVLIFISALMYAGRDAIHGNLPDNFNDYINDRSSYNIKSLAHSIIEKTPAAKYIAIGAQSFAFTSHKKLDEICNTIGCLFNSIEHNHENKPKQLQEYMNKYSQQK